MLLLSEDEHDRWCECEPPEGYLVFETLQVFDIDDVTDECLANLTRMRADQATDGPNPES